MKIVINDTVEIDVWWNMLYLRWGTKDLYFTPEEGIIGNRYLW